MCMVGDCGQDGVHSLRVHHTTQNSDLLKYVRIVSAPLGDPGSSSNDVFSVGCQE